MDTDESRWESFLSIIFRPRLLLQGVVEYISAWLFTRNWRRILPAILPILLLLAAMATIITLGATTAKSTMIERYVEWIDEEMPATLSALDAEVNSEDAAQPAEQPGNDGGDGLETTEPENESDFSGLAESITPDGELLLRRMLQLNNDNARATYLVAGQLVRQGRIGQAQQMMRRIAPEGGGGFAPGHAWLAGIQIQNQEIQSQEDWQRFEGDVEAALQWPGTSSRLIAIYATQLAEMRSPDPNLKRKQIDKAIRVLEQSVKRYPDLRITLANIAAKYNRKRSLDRVSSQAKAEIRAKMEDGSATVEDLTNLANLFLYDDPDKALTVCKMALERESNNAALRRIQSEAYRIKYLESLVQEGDDVNVNLALLDAALKSDPTNPGVTLEIAKLIAAGKSAPPEMEKTLQTQILNGQATALARILLADRYLSEGDVEQAIPHLEAALEQAPDNPSVLNNLALALSRTRTEPEVLNRALAMASQAVTLSPEDAEFRDTLGEIQARTGDKLSALASYEAAISIDAGRLETRQNLVALYRELGMVDMAEMQQAEIDRRSQQ